MNGRVGAESPLFTDGAFVKLSPEIRDDLPGIGCRVVGHRPRSRTHSGGLSNHTLTRTPSPQASLV
jgi:hypothetical protein